MIEELKEELAQQVENISLRPIPNKQLSSLEEAKDVILQALAQAFTDGRLFVAIFSVASDDSLQMRARVTWSFNRGRGRDVIQQLSEDLEKEMAPPRTEPLPDAKLLAGAMRVLQLQPDDDQIPETAFKQSPVEGNGS